ncbi:MAG: hypothetical protein OEZ06_22360 [Myxococcales bacterium]|nr:hypothetical protein [Myxococcales bacterium]
MKSKLLPLLGALAFGLCLAPAQSSLAKPLEGDTVRIFGLGELGLGGSLSNDASMGEVDLSPSYGGALGVDFGLHDLFAAGLMLRVVSYKPTAEIIEDLQANAVLMAMQSGSVNASASAETAVLGGRSSTFDIDLYPRLRLPFPAIELYAMVPFGLSTLSPPDGAESEGGWNFGIHGGVGLRMIAVLQIIAQFGHSWHYFDSGDISETTLNLGLALGF